MDAASALDVYLRPTKFLDFLHPALQEKTDLLLTGIDPADQIAKAIKLFYFVRDEIKYVVKYEWRYYSKKNSKASATLTRGYGYCIQKSALLAAMARYAGIPARLHFVDIVNYLTSQKYIDKIGSNIFVFHGFVDLYLDGKWVEANVAFDKDLCEKKGYPIGEFDGRTPCLFSHFDAKGKKFVEYLKDRGTFADVPFRKILWTWLIEYGFHKRRVQSAV
jgi:hypothetical protein